jgi:hypothetical protein
LFTVVAVAGNTPEVHMTQMLLIEETTELEIPSGVLAAARIGGCFADLDLIEDTFVGVPENEELDEVLAARCGSL